MKKKSKRKVMTVGSAGLFATLAFAIFFQQNFHTIKVDGRSMEPTFKNGDRLLASKAYWLIGDLRDNDIVVIEGENPGEHLIKRIYRKSGEIVDWANIPEDYSMAKGEFVVPSGEVYLLGDNRDVSEDSRKFGSVEKNRIIGKIVLKRWL